MTDNNPLIQIEQALGLILPGAYRDFLAQPALRGALKSYIRQKRVLQQQLKDFETQHAGKKYRL